MQARLEKEEKWLFTAGVPLSLQPTSITTPDLMSKLNAWWLDVHLENAVGRHFFFNHCERPKYIFSPDTCSSRLSNYKSLKHSMVRLF